MTSHPHKKNEHSNILKNYTSELKIHNSGIMINKLLCDCEREINKLVKHVYPEIDEMETATFFNYTYLKLLELIRENSNK